MAHERGYAAQRQLMVERDLKARGITDERVLAAMAAVPRERFVPPGAQARAYADSPLPVECSQTISQPFVVAWMAQLARIRPSDKVLEIGTGTGYAAAVLSELAGEVISLERHAALARSAARRLAGLGYPVSVHVADGADGWEPGAPFDVIISAAASQSVPAAWLRQAGPGGRIIAPLGGPMAQELTVMTRLGPDPQEDGQDDERAHEVAPRFSVERAGAVRFVPLVAGLGPSSAR